MGTYSELSNYIDKFLRIFVFTLISQEAGDSEVFCWRNVFACINLLRILNKLTKWKHSRTMVSMIKPKQFICDCFVYQPIRSATVTYLPNHQCLSIIYLHWAYTRLGLQQLIKYGVIYLDVSIVTKLGLDFQVHGHTFYFYYQMVIMFFSLFLWLPYVIISAGFLLWQLW